MKRMKKVAVMFLVLLGCFYLSSMAGAEGGYKSSFLYNDVFNRIEANSTSWQEVESLISRNPGIVSLKTKQPDKKILSLSTRDDKGIIQSAAYLFLVFISSDKSEANKPDKNSVISGSSIVKEVSYRYSTRDAGRIIITLFKPAKVTLGIEYRLVEKKEDFHWKEEGEQAYLSLFGIIRGLKIKYVYPDSPAEKAGLTSGNFILKADGRDVTKNQRALSEYIAGKQAGDTVRLELRMVQELRSPFTKTITITLFPVSKLAWEKKK